MKADMLRRRARGFCRPLGGERFSFCTPPLPSLLQLPATFIVRIFDHIQQGTSAALRQGSFAI